MRVCVFDGDRVVFEHVVIDGSMQAGIMPVCTMPSRAEAPQAAEALDVAREFLKLCLRPETSRS